MCSFYESWSIFYKNSQLERTKHDYLYKDSSLVCDDLIYIEQKDKDGKIVNFSYSNFKKSSASFHPLYDPEHSSSFFPKKINNQKILLNRTSKTSL